MSATNPAPEKVSFFNRRPGKRYVMRTALSPSQVEAEFERYYTAGKDRAELQHVGGRTVVAKRVGANYEMRAFKTYLWGIMTTAFCSVQQAGRGSQVETILSSTRFGRVYLMLASLVGIILIMVFAPSEPIWVSGLLLLAALLIFTSTRLSRRDRGTVEEQEWLLHHITQILDAELDHETAATTRSRYADERKTREDRKKT